MTESYRRDTLELTLEGVDGDGPLSGKRKPEERLITVTLIWPRPLIAERVAARPHFFAEGGLDLSGADWSDCVMFKENVEGPFGMVVQISEPLTSQQAARVIADLGSALVKTAGTEAARVAAGPWLASLARFPFSHLAGELSGVGKSPKVVAAGRMTLRPGLSGPVDIPLQVPDDVVRTRTVRTGGRSRSRRETLHRRGEPAGTVMFNSVYYRGL